MGDLKYQLVFQFEVSMIEAFDDLMDLEDFLIVALSPIPDTLVDGHDSGLGELNIFIHTNRPEQLFEQVAELVNERRPGIPFSAGYRAFTEDVYKPLWPLGSNTFKVA